MGKLLDIDDVCAGNPLAEKELHRLRATASALKQDAYLRAYRAGWNDAMQEYRIELLKLTFSIGGIEGHHWLARQARNIELRLKRP